MKAPATGPSYASDIAYVLFKRKWFILVVSVSVTLAIVLAAVARPESYKARALVLMKRERTELLLTPQAPILANAATPRTNIEQELRSEAEMLKRPSLLGNVVQRIGVDVAARGTFAPERPDELLVPVAVAQRLGAQLGLVRPAIAAVPVPPGPPRPASPDAVDRVVRSLGSKLKVVPIDNSNVLEVTFEANEPRFASTVVDLLIKDYLANYAKLRTTPATVQFFERQVTRLRSELRQAEDAMQQYEAQEGLSALGPQREVYLRNALERETALQHARSEFEELGEKARVLRERLAELPERVRTGEDMRVNPVFDVMRTRVLDLEMERNKLLQKFTGEDRRVADVEREIELLRQRFLSERTWEPARESWGDNPVRNPLLVDLVNTEATLLRVRVRTKMLERDMQDFYGRLRHIDRAAYERARLDRRVKALEEAYLMYAKKYEEARISYAMDQSRLVNVTLAEPVYVTPIAQRGTDQLGLLGAAVALLTGVGAAFLRESFSRSFTTEASVPRHLSLPLLGSVGNRRA